VRAIAEAHGAKATIVHTEPAGATVRLRFPSAAGTGEAGSSQPALTCGP
jgi:hypothetical protein